jgi:hypothetical protein
VYVLLSSIGDINMFHKLLKLAEMDLIKNGVLSVVIAIAFAWYHYVAITGFFFLIFLVMVCATGLDIVFALLKKLFMGSKQVKE